MPIKRCTPKQIIGMLRRAELELAAGKTTGEVCRSLGISEQSYYRRPHSALGYRPPAPAAGRPRPVLPDRPSTMQ